MNYEYMKSACIRCKLNLQCLIKRSRVVWSSLFLVGAAALLDAYQTQFGDTALIMAAAHGRAACVRLLAERGADKEAKSVVRQTI